MSISIAEVCAIIEKGGRNAPFSKAMDQHKTNCFHKYPPLIVFLAGLLFSPANSAQTALEPGVSCTNSSCHSSLGSSGNNHVLSAMGENCQLCHKPADPVVHKFQPAIPGGEICKQCHAPLIANEHKHVPAAAGMCTSCHQIHEANYAKQLRVAPELLCKSCHSQTASAEAFSRHLPAVKGECVQCHDPHSSNHDKQLKSGMPDLCFSCHNQPQHDEGGYVIPPVEPLYLNKNLNQHPSFGRGECLLCHNPHGSENYRLQKGNYPKSFYADFSTTRYFCFNCHNNKAFTEGRTVTETGFRNGDLNLHYRHVNREKGRTCRACHHHHASDRDALVTHDVPFGDRTITIEEFTQTDTGGTCTATCHIPMSYDRVTPAVNNLAVTRFEISELEPNLQQPAATPPETGESAFQSTCSVCHGKDAQGGMGGMAPAITGASAAQIGDALSSVPMMGSLTELDSGDIEAVARYLSSLPQSGAEDSSASGHDLYTTHCASCHGVDRKGGLGGMAPDINGKSIEQIKNGILTVPMMQQLESLMDSDLVDIAQYLQGID